MAVFVYQAFDQAKSRIRGSVAADSLRQAREQLRNRGLVVESIAAQAVRQDGILDRLFAQRYASQMVGCIRELATLLGVGIPLLEAIDTLIAQHAGRVRDILLQLRERIAAGASLATAMQEQRLYFDDMSIQMVEVGQDAGTLDVVLEQLASYKERAQQLQGRILTALIYPTFVFLMGIGVSLFLMTTVIPPLMEQLVEAKRELPWVTLCVKTVSDFVLAYGLFVAAAVGVLAMAAIAFSRTTRGRFFCHRALLKIPILGELVRKQAIVRIALVMSTLMRSGVVFLRAIEIAGKATSNVAIRAALAECERAVQAGRDIGASLGVTQMFPPMVVQIFAVGQQTGRLEEMLDRLAANYDAQVQSGAQRFAALIDPILILALAVFVGFIVFATILPILEAGNVM